MRIKSELLKLVLAALGMASALSGSSADTAATSAIKATPIPDNFPKNGLQLWLSAGQAKQTDGVITALKDLSGNENHAQRDPASATPATNPSLATDAASGQPVLRFSGANIAFAFKRITDIRTAFWVVSKDAAAFGKRNEKFVLGDKESNDFHAGWTDDTIFNRDVNPGHLSKLLHDGKTWLNGQSIDASQTPFPKQLGLISIVSTGPVKAGQLAQDRTFSGRSWQGDIAEILLYNVELPDADRQTVENYLMAKYAIKPSTNVIGAPGTINGKEQEDLNIYVPPFDAAAAGLTRLFDDKTLTGWVGDTGCWKVIDGAIVGVKGNQNLMTVGDYDDFRLIVSTRQVKEPSNHQGVGFWGENMPEGKYGYGGCVDVMPPMNWTWDYTVNRGAPGKLTISRDLDKELGIKRSQWTQAEILVNRAKGTIRMAVNGIEMLYYTDDNPGRLKQGPIGLQAHGGNKDVRYKDIFIEVAPKEDRLITLKK
jgi:hypothetical protein